MKFPFWRSKRQEQLGEELQSHLQMATRDRIERGQSPEIAARTARQEFGNVSLIGEVTRDQWRWNWLGDALQDLRYASRLMARSPGFTIVAVLTLALGIGANTAIFSLIDAFLLRLLPVKDPQQLVLIHATLPKGRTHSDFPWPAFERFRDTNSSFSAMFAWDDASASVSVDGQAQLSSADFVSGNYFDVLGVGVLLGRAMNPQDDQPGSKPVAVISYPYWEERFARSPAAIGKNIYVAKIPFTIIGVTLPGFTGRSVAGRPADIVLPMSVHPQLALRDHDTFEIMARLQPGVTLERARADLDVIYHGELRQEAGSRLTPQAEQNLQAQRIELIPAVRGASPGDTSRLAQELRILACVVGVALLIACVNIACLMLARSSARQKEIAVRVAIGARRGRLIRQLLTESLLLSCLAGLLGLFLAKWSADFLLTILSAGQAMVSLNARVLVFSSGLSFLTAIAFGLAPALVGTRIDLHPVLKSGGAQHQSRFGRHRLTKALVVSQVALSLTLLIGAGLLVRSLRFLYAVDTGFERSKVLQFWVLPVLNGYDHPAEMSLYRQLLEKLNQLPGVESASLSRLRMIFGRWNREIFPSGSTRTIDDAEVYCDPVGPRFFETMGIPLLIGREFSPSDAETSAKVAVISESMARKFFPGENPIGHRFRFDHADVGPEIEVVGVVKDIKHRVDRNQPPEAAFIPYTQAPLDEYGQMNFVLRSSGDPASLISSVRAAVQSIDKTLPAVGIGTQEAEIDEYLRDQRSITALLTVFAALALILAAIGLYGTMSYSVALRTRELGIRVALGAHRVELLGMVLRETLSLVTLGVLLGVPLALSSTRLISSMLFTVRGTDPLAIGVAIIFMAMVSLLATYLPARRAMRVDPILALRCE